MIKVKFSHVSEIRMGSPFNGATVEILGEWQPNLPDPSCFQDKFSLSQDGNQCALVKWSWDEKGDPFFQVVLLDEQKKEAKISEPIEGCCEEIELIRDGNVRVQVFRNVDQFEVIK